MLKNYEFLKDNFYIFLGSVLCSLGVVLFLAPNSIITGGTAGLSLLLHYITSFTIGTWMVLVNVPLLLLGGKYFGKSYAIKSIITIVLISLLIDFFNEVLKLKPITDEFILASIFGGILIGIGIGLIIKGKSSAGGTSIIATIIASKTKYKASEAMLFIDTLVIALSIYVLNDVEKALWSVLSIYVSSRLIDIILTGRPSKKVVYLVTNEVKLLSEKIKESLGPEGTIIEGKDLEYSKDKKMILIVVDISKIQILRNLCKSYDKDSFLVITEASELHGRGH